jgi:hypothetical protein
MRLAMHLVEPARTHAIRQRTERLFRGKQVIHFLSVSRDSPSLRYPQGIKKRSVEAIFQPHRHCEERSDEAIFQRLVDD